MLRSSSCLNSMFHNIMAWLIVFSLIFIACSQKTMANQSLHRENTLPSLLNDRDTSAQSVSSVLCRSDMMPVYAVREKNGSLRCVLMDKTSSAQSAYFTIITLASSENTLDEEHWEVDELYLDGDVFPAEGLHSLVNRVKISIWTSCLEEHFPCEIGYVYNKKEKQWFLILKKGDNSYFRYDIENDQFVECDGETYKNFALPLNNTM